MPNPFWESVDPILKDVSVTKVIFGCLSINWKTIFFHSSNIYGSTTRVTRLKVAPNMADPISLNEKVDKVEKKSSQDTAMKFIGLKKLV